MNFKKQTSKNNEQEKLESELKIMEHAGEIKTRFQQVSDLISSSEYASMTSLKEARNHLTSIASFSSRYEGLKSRLDSLVIELDDLVSEVEHEGDSVEFDPERTEIVKERLSLLYRLLKKHRVQDVKELITIQESLEAKDALTSNLDETLRWQEKNGKQQKRKCFRMQHN